MTFSKLLTFAAAVVAFSGCQSLTGPTPPHHDQEDGGGKPVYQPMLVVPMPSLQRSEAAGGRPMDALQARRTPIGDVLLALFKDSDINLMIDPSVQATECTFDIKKSTVEEAFEALLTSLDRGYEWDGNYLRVRDRVRATLHIDLIDAGSTQQGGGGGGGAGGAGGAGASGGGGGQAIGFWQDIQAALPTLLGENATSVINRSVSTIHVEARPSGIARLRELVDTTVRRANKQVSLEARILEVRLDDQHSLGVNWSVLPNLFNSNKGGLAGGGAIAAQTAASGGTAFRFGVLDTGDFSVFVDALQSQGQLRVLSSPRVSAMNNQSASIGVTDQIPVITRQVIDDQGVARTEYGVDFVEAGVTLQVHPVIGEDGVLSVSLTPQVREQTGTVITPDGLVQVPIISQRETTTIVRVASGQAIALGGLRSTRKNETRQGVPFFMDLPYLGQLFSSTVQNRVEVELIILLSPRILDDTWIDEEIRRGSHRLVQLRRGFQWNSIQLDSYRPEDWSSGSLQGRAMAAPGPEAHLRDSGPLAMPKDAGLTVTRKGLASHMLAKAQMELDQGHQRQAIATIEKALDLEPDNHEALVAAGTMHSRNGNPGRARQLLERAIVTGADDVLALTARGALELTDGTPHAARRFLQRAHEIANTPMTAANLGGALLALGEQQQALELMRASAGADAPPELHANLAFAELQAGHVELAQASLINALSAGADTRNPRVAALQNLVAMAQKPVD